MRKSVAAIAFVFAFGAAAPAWADCAGHVQTVKAPGTTTTQTAQTTIPTPDAGEDKGG